MPRLEKAEWIEVYATLEKPLYNVVYRLIWDASRSQDIVQEAFLRCWKRRAEIRSDGFKALLYRTALNLAMNQRRRDRLWRLVGLADAEERHGTTAAATRSFRGAFARRSTRCPSVSRRSCC